MECGTGSLEGVSCSTDMDGKPPPPFSFFFKLCFFDFFVHLVLGIFLFVCLFFKRNVYNWIALQ